MIKSLLAASAAIAIMTGGAFAQSSAPPGMQQTSPYAPPNAIVPTADTVDSTTHKTVTNSDGVVTEKNKSVSHDGDTTTVRKSTDTSVVR